MIRATVDDPVEKIADCQPQQYEPRLHPEDSQQDADVQTQR